MGDGRHVGVGSRRRDPTRCRSNRKTKIHTYARVSRQRRENSPPPVCSRRLRPLATAMPLASSQKPPRQHSDQPLPCFAVFRSSAHPFLCTLCPTPASLLVTSLHHCTTGGLCRVLQGLHHRGRATAHHGPRARAASGRLPPYASSRGLARPVPHRPEHSPEGCLHTLQGELGHSWRGGAVGGYGSPGPRLPTAVCDSFVILLCSPHPQLPGCWSLHSHRHILHSGPRSSVRRRRHAPGDAQSSET